MAAVNADSTLFVYNAKASCFGPAVKFRAPIWADPKPDPGDPGDPGDSGDPARANYKAANHRPAAAAAAQPQIN